MKKLYQAVLAASLLAPLAAQAEMIMASAGGLPSYTYVEAGYVELQPDNFHQEPDGYAIRGSYLFWDHIYVEGQYASYEDTIHNHGFSYYSNGTTTIYSGSGSADLEVDVFGASVGWTAALGKHTNTSWHASLDYVSTEADLDLGGVSINRDAFDDDDDDAIGATVGLRSNVMGPYLEVGIEGSYLEAEHNDNDATVATVHGMLRATESIGVRAEASYDDNENLAYFLGVRYSF